VGKGRARGNETERNEQLWWKSEKAWGSNGEVGLTLWEEREEEGARMRNEDKRLRILVCESGCI
jgi:hypothetical protein